MDNNCDLTFEESMYKSLMVYTQKHNSHWNKLNKI